MAKINQKNAIANDSYAYKIPGYLEKYKEKARFQQQKISTVSSPLAQICQNWCLGAGEYYHGNVDFNFTKCGQGIYFSLTKKLLYIGTWNEDQWYGQGYLILNTGCTLYGKFRHGKIHGPGVFALQNKTLLGYFTDSKLNGIAYELTESDKEVKYQKCEFDEGRLVRYTGLPLAFPNNNQIPYCLKDFRSYWTTYQDYRAKISFQDQNENSIKSIKIDQQLNYIGYTKQGQLNGLGVCFQKDRVKFYGNFKSGLMNGLGVIFLDEGDVYQGEFKSGLMNGFGIHYISDINETQFGLFKEGEMEHEFSKLKGRPDDRVYEDLVFELSQNDTYLNTNTSISFYEVSKVKQIDQFNQFAILNHSVKEPVQKESSIMKLKKLSNVMKTASKFIGNNSKKSSERDSGQAQRASLSQTIKKDDISKYLNQKRISHIDYSYFQSDRSEQLSIRLNHTQEEEEQPKIIKSTQKQQSNNTSKLKHNLISPPKELQKDFSLYQSKSDKDNTSTPQSPAPVVPFEPYKKIDYQKQIDFDFDDYRQRTKINSFIEGMRPQQQNESLRTIVNESKAPNNSYYFQQDQDSTKMEKFNSPSVTMKKYKIFT